MDYQKIYSTHRRKIIVGAPIIFLLLVNISGISGGNIFYFSAENSVFASVGDAVPLRLNVSTKSPVNAIGGKVVFPKDVLQADAVTRSSSLIDLWSEDPTVSNDTGTISWSGGIVNDNTDTEIHGTVFTIQFRAAKVGKARIRVEDGELLAKNGEGTNILSGQNGITIYVREAGYASPDINKDGALSISDVNSLYLKTFGDYNAEYDINHDGRLNWNDVTTLVSLL